jgi:hypothetical protein
MRHVGSTVMVSALALISGAGAVARAQATADDVPVYPQPLTHPELGTVDTLIFDPVTISVPMRVPLEQVQDYVDAIAPGRFVAVARADDPATTGIVFTNVWQRVTSTAPNATSRVAFFATLDDRVTGLRRTAVLDIYSTDADEVDAFFGGADAARQADISWEIRERDGTTRYAFVVRGEDGFRMDASMTVATAAWGTLVRSGSTGSLVQFIALGDGPGGTHPGFVNVGHRYDIAALDTVVDNYLRLRFGTFDVLEVISSGPTFPHLRRSSHIALRRIP